jgi:hypothetical protein
MTKYQPNAGDNATVPSLRLLRHLFKMNAYILQKPGAGGAVFFTIILVVAKKCGREHKSIYP